MTILDKMKTYNRKYMIIGVAFTVIFGLMLGYLSADLYTKYSQSKDIVKGKDISQVSEVSASDIKLEENATIVFNRVYLKCNELNREQKVVEENAVGKNKSQLEELFVGWNIVEFSPEQLILQKKINSYSPQYYKLGAYDNTDGEKMVAVYTFDIDGKEVLEDVTSTPLSLLHEKEINKLDQGIFVKGKERLYEILENYDE